jgi:hypothetical protein
LSILPHIGQEFLDGAVDAWRLGMLGGNVMGLDDSGALVCQGKLPDRLTHYTAVVAELHSAALGTLKPGKSWHPDAWPQLQAAFPGTELVPAFFTYPEVAGRLRDRGIPLQGAWYAAPGALRAWAPLLDAAALLQSAFTTDYALLLNTVASAAQYDAYTELHPDVLAPAAVVIRELFAAQLWETVPELRGLQDVVAPADRSWSES